MTLSFDWAIIRDDVILFIVLGVFTFHQLSKLTKQSLLSILVMAIIVWYMYQYLQKKATNVLNKQQHDETFFDKEGESRKELATDQEFVATFPKKGFRFLKYNTKFMEIAKHVVICRMFDRARFADLLLHLDKCQKVYMYILDGRYSPSTHVPIFFDMREGVLSLLYSMYFVIPKNLKHVYGLSPHDRIAESIDRFLSITQEMIDVLRSYTHKTAKIPYFPEVTPSSADQPFDAMKTRVLP
jgi:hypothetical protein